MLLILLNSIAVHTVHVLRAAMLAQTRALLPIRTGSPQGPRILLLVNARTDGKTIVSVEVALERTGGKVMRVTERVEAEQLVRRWDPEVPVCGSIHEFGVSIQQRDQHAIAPEAAGIQCLQPHPWDKNDSIESIHPDAESREALRGNIQSL